MVANRMRRYDNMDGSREAYLALGDTLYTRNPYPAGHRYPHPEEQPLSPLLQT